MIRGTINQGTSHRAKNRRTLLAFSGTGTRGESVELVLQGATEAAAVRAEKKEIDATLAYSSQQPSNYHNGPFE